MQLLDAIFQLAVEEDLWDLSALNAGPVPALCGGREGERHEAALVDSTLDFRLAFLAEVAELLALDDHECGVDFVRFCLECPA